MSLHHSRVLAFAVSRSFMPLGVAQFPEFLEYMQQVDESWLYAVRRCSNIEVKLLTAIA
ncbi:hypothetical protein [Nostoc sp. DSM 114159]